MEPAEWNKMATLEGWMELLMQSAREIGYDKELLYLVGGFMFSDRITQTDITSRLREFKETKYAKLDAIQKNLLLMGFENYMLIAHDYNPEVRPAIKEVVDCLENTFSKDDRRKGHCCLMPGYRF